MDNSAIYKLLGLKPNDTGAKDKVEAIIALTEARLKNLLGGADAVPEKLEYIVTEVTISRYNRIGSEGTSSHNVEGESMTWNNDSDFDAYKEDIAAYLQENGTNRGKLVLI